MNPAFFGDELKKQQEFNERIAEADGDEDSHALYSELGEEMTEHCTVIRHNDKLATLDDKLQELHERWHRIRITDRGSWANEELLFARHLYNMLQLARVMVVGAFKRNESRGAHYKPEFPNRDDANWLKTTKARWKTGGPEFTYEDVDVQFIKPRPRRYDT